jgi:CubicO group peptidase (beta-lactamase class C family)
VTIRDLLSHSSGGWAGDEGGAGDPVFAQNWASQSSTNAGAQTAMINWAVDHEPLRFQPGTAYGYSNFGFALLGRIIEAVATKFAGTPQQYDTWVRQNILIPVGATDMQIGQNSKSAKWPNEVTYYDPTGQGDPYSWNIPLMEANGGWVASAIDLLRFAVHVDSLTPPADILLPSTEATMLTPFTLLWPPNYTSTQNSGYGLGWGIGPDTTTVPACQITPTNPCTIQSHDGYLGPGTISNLFITSSGLSYALIANSQTLKEPDTLNSVVTGVSAWPTHDSSNYDLFQQPNLAIYDPPTLGGAATQCTVGSTTMHCCPSGYVMIGADDSNNVFKCAPVLTAGTVTLDPAPGGSAYQCNGMHCCPPNQVMVGMRTDQNILACMALPSGSITAEIVDYHTIDTNPTVDSFPIHVCDAVNPVAAMAGINVSLNQLTCATDPHLQ